MCIASGTELFLRVVATLGSRWVVSASSRGPTGWLSDASGGQAHSCPGKCGAEQNSCLHCPFVVIYSFHLAIPLFAAFYCQSFCCILLPENTGLGLLYGWVCFDMPYESTRAEASPGHWVLALQRGGPPAQEREGVSGHAAEFLQRAACCQPCQRGAQRGGHGGECQCSASAAVKVTSHLQ